MVLYIEDLVCRDPPPPPARPEMKKMECGSRTFFFVLPWMGRGGTASPPEAEWSSGVAAFWGASYNQDISKDPKKRHDHVSVLHSKDM